MERRFRNYRKILGTAALHIGAWHNHMAIPQAAEAHSPELRREEGHASGDDGAFA